MALGFIELNFNLLGFITMGFIAMGLIAMGFLALGIIELGFISLSVITLCFIVLYSIGLPIMDCSLPALLHQSHCRVWGDHLQKGVCSRESDCRKVSAGSLTAERCLQEVCPKVLPPAGSPVWTLLYWWLQCQWGRCPEGGSGYRSSLWTDWRTSQTGRQSKGEKNKS